MMVPSRFSLLSAVPNRDNNICSRRYYHPAAEGTTLKGSYENIIVDVHSDSKVALITLNRPKALNALNDALFQDLLHATLVLDGDDDIRCMVLTGSKKAFAAGADISEMQSKGFEECYGRDMFAEWQQVSKLKTPIIAAISGYCLGGGCELAMVRIAGWQPGMVFLT
jgi:enoyl-CoA hydratase